MSDRKTIPGHIDCCISILQELKDGGPSTFADLKGLLEGSLYLPHALSDRPIWEKRFLSCVTTLVTTNKIVSTDGNKLRIAPQGINVLNLSPQNQRSALQRALKGRDISFNDVPTEIWTAASEPFAVPLEPSTASPAISDTPEAAIPETETPLPSDEDAKMESVHPNTGSSVDGGSKIYLLRIPEMKDLAIKFLERGPSASDMIKDSILGAAVCPPGSYRKFRSRFHQAMHQLKLDGVIDQPERRGPYSLNKPSQPKAEAGVSAASFRGPVQGPAQPEAVQAEAPQLAPETMQNETTMSPAKPAAAKPAKDVLADEGLETKTIQPLVSFHRRGVDAAIGTRGQTAKTTLAAFSMGMELDKPCLLAIVQAAKKVNAKVMLIHAPNGIDAAAVTIMGAMKALNGIDAIRV